MTSRLEIERDERRVAEDPPPRRRAVIRGALLSLVVAGLVGGSWWAGHSNKPMATDLSAVPVIHPDAAPVKEAPANPGGMVVPGQDSVLLNHDDQPKREELLPPAEAVKQRPIAALAAPPAPSPAPVVTAPAASPAPPPVAAPSSLGNAASPPVASVAPAHASATPATPAASPPAAQVATAAPALVAPPAKATPAIPAAAGGYRLQLGALKTDEAARQEWMRLQRQYPDVLGKLSLTVSRVDLGDRGIYYRIQAGPMVDAAQAAQSCAALKSRNVGCILVKP